jgi:hypothetical protein
VTSDPHAGVWFTCIALLFHHQSQLLLVPKGVKMSNNDCGEWQSQEKMVDSSKSYSLWLIQDRWL